MMQKQQSSFFFYFYPSIYLSLCVCLQRPSLKSLWYVCVCACLSACVRTCVFVQRHRATPWLSVLNNWWLHPSLSLSLLLRQAPALFLRTRILLFSLLFHSTDVANPSLTLGSVDGGPEGLWGDLNHVEWTFLTDQQRNGLQLSDDGFPEQRATAGLRAAGDTLCNRPNCKIWYCEAGSVSMVTFLTTTEKPPILFYVSVILIPVHS